ncbi:MAG TPA: adenylyl-sulfate kinase [Lacunisphaera sp.]|nr:adenylyl-sulfate kinase [Lacunisphaera sp.]
MNETTSASSPSGVIWITGYSAAGKTTVGRKVESRLRAEGLNTVFLDGDDLRSIFGAKWGYSRAERVELAHVYFRLCSHLAAQGNTVIIAAVAMYREVSEWMHRHIPHAVEVYLQVPEAARRARDTSTKKVYHQLAGQNPDYDEPVAADLVIANHDGVMPDEVSDRIARFYLAQPVRRADFGRQSHWQEYYSKAVAPQQPSSFATLVAAQLAPGTRLLEVGCGNGRDAAFFARARHQVTALDVSDAAIESCRQTHAGLPIDFRAGPLPAHAAAFTDAFDAIYCRFVLHAMPLAEEISLLEAATDCLRENGLFFIECRSINDPLARRGKVISPTERIHGHYRRFLVLDDLVARLAAAGFRVLDQAEAAGVAAHGDDDPVVLRLKAQKCTAPAVVRFPPSAKAS